MKLLLALLEVGQFLLDRDAQLFEVLGGIVGERGTGRRDETGPAEKQRRHADPGGHQLNNPHTVYPVQLVRN